MSQTPWAELLRLQEAAAGRFGEDANRRLAVEVDRALGAPAASASRFTPGAGGPVS